MGGEPHYGGGKTLLFRQIISLLAKDTKDKEPRKIAVDNELYEMFKDMLRAIHDNHIFLYNV